jgi:hypothetical protein
MDRIVGVFTLNAATKLNCLVESKRLVWTRLRRDSSQQNCFVLLRWVGLLMYITLTGTSCVNRIHSRDRGTGAADLLVVGVQTAWRALVRASCCHNNINNNSVTAEQLDSCLFIVYSCHKYIYQRAIYLYHVKQDENWVKWFRCFRRMPFWTINQPHLEALKSIPTPPGVSGLLREHSYECVT